MPQRHHQLDLDPHIPVKTAHAPQHVSVANQDTLTWHCAQDFEIVNIQQMTNDPAHPFDPTRPPNPFYRPLNFHARASTPGAGHPGGAPGGRSVANSGPAVSAAVGGHYEVTFRVVATGQVIDPDFIVD
jgi:hypothetical protein